MYCQFFRLQTNPFNSIPGPNYYFLPQSHRLVLNQINHAIFRKNGILLLLGSAGIGKTTLIKRHILRKDGHRDVVFDDLNEHVNTHFSTTQIDYPGSAIEAALTRQSADKKSVLLLDYTDNLDNKILEKIFLAISQRNQRNQPTLLILMGSTNLVEQCDSLHSEPFKHLLCETCVLPQLAVGIVNEYINYRLRFVGYSGKPLFSNAAIQLITELSQGTPRMINTLCGNSLFQARMMNTHVISEAIINQANNILSWEKEDLPDTGNQLESTLPPVDQIASQLAVANITPNVKQEQQSNQDIDQSLQEIHQMLADISHIGHRLQSSSEKAVQPSLARQHIKISQKPEQPPSNSITSSQLKKYPLLNKNTGLSQRRMSRSVVPESASTFVPTSTANSQFKFTSRSKLVASSQPVIESKFLSPLYKTSAVAAAVLLVTTTIYWIIEAQLAGNTSYRPTNTTDVPQTVNANQEKIIAKEENIANNTQTDEMVTPISSDKINIMPPQPKPNQPQKKLADIATMDQSFSMTSNTRLEKQVVERVKPVTKKPEIVALPSKMQTAPDRLELAAETRAAARYKLAQQGVSYNEQGFLASAATGNNTRLKLFLNASMPVDIQDKASQNTALINATAHGNLSTVQLILSQKPSINRKNQFGKTALMIAVEKKQLDIIKTLLNHGADPHVRDASGQTALSIAQKNNDPQILSLLKFK